MWYSDISSSDLLSGGCGLLRYTTELIEAGVGHQPSGFISVRTSDE